MSALSAAISHSSEMNQYEQNLVILEGISSSIFVSKSNKA